MVESYSQVNNAEGDMPQSVPDWLIPKKVKLGGIEIRVYEVDEAKKALAVLNNAKVILGELTDGREPVEELTALGARTEDPEARAVDVGGLVEFLDGVSEWSMSRSKNFLGGSEIIGKNEETGHRFAVGMNYTLEQGTGGRHTLSMLSIQSFSEEYLNAIYHRGGDLSISNATHTVTYPSAPTEP